MDPPAFWSVEVKAESPVTIKLDSGKTLRISQVALDKGHIEIGDIITLCVRIDNKTTVVGSLSATCRQFTCRFIFEKEFELSHDWKNGSVHFSGYSGDLPGVYPFRYGKKGGHVDTPRPSGKAEITHI